MGPTSEYRGLTYNKCGNSINLMERMEKNGFELIWVNGKRHFMSSSTTKNSGTREKVGLLLFYLRSRGNHGKMVEELL